MTDRTINVAYLVRVKERLNALRTTLNAGFPPGIREITWEIGSGHGHFLTKFAELNPDRLCVGIDLLGDRLRKAEKKQAVAAVSNLKFIKAEAEEFLRCLPVGIKIQDVLILFPDPWPKKRHHKNRLIQSTFLDALAPRMISGGRLYFRTDHKPYLEWARELLSTRPNWVLLPNAPWILEEQTVFQARAPSFGSLVAEFRTRGQKETPTG